MAHWDPSAEQHGDYYDQSYTDAHGFSSYNNAQPHQAYDRGGYDPYGAGKGRDDVSYGQFANPGTPAVAPGHYKSESTQNLKTFARATAESRPQDMKHWRFEHHGILWTKGGRAACIGRFCGCTLMIIVFLVVSILLPLALWTRPPNIVVGGVQASSNGSEIQLLSNGVQMNLEIPIYVNNPNYFSVSFSSIKANIYYPINNTLIGGGQQNDVTFHSHSATNFTFPFSIEYTTTMASGAQIFADLATKCGIGGGAVSDITVDYDITLGLRVLFFTVWPTISNSASFLCPLTESEIASLSSALTGGG